MLFSAIGWGFSLAYFTCAVNAVSDISWYACTIVRAFSVVTESIGVAVMLSCLTLVDVCKMVNRKALIYLEQHTFYSMNPSTVCWISFVENHFDDYPFLWLRATIREVAKPDDTPLHGKIDGLLVMSFPSDPQRGNVFSLHTSFINPWMSVNFHT